MRTRSGELEVSKVLATNKAFLIRGDETGRVAGDIISQRGKLSNGICEWRDLTAQTTNGNSAHEIPIVVCASDAELYVLVRLGISCTPMAGVDRLTGKQVRALFKARAIHAQQRRYQLVLLGWQPETFSKRRRPGTWPRSATLLPFSAPMALIQRPCLVSGWRAIPRWREFRRTRLPIHRLSLADLNQACKSPFTSPAEALVRIADRKRITW